jgi:hypothetical protein
MADIVINPSVGKIDFFTNRGDQNPANTARLTGNTILFTGPLSASSISTGGGGAFVTSVQPTANYLSKFTGNSTIANSLIYDNGTNIGIGTTSPAYKLHVEGTGTQRINVVTTDGASAGSGIYFQVKNAGSLVSNSTLTIDNTGNLKIFTGTSTESERMRVTSTGCVGIGTTSVRLNSLLDVYGSGVFGTSAYGFYVGTDATGTFLDAGTQLIRMFAGQSERMRIATDGNVGIGTTNPAVKLHVNSTTAGSTVVRADGTSGTLFSVVDDLTDSLMSVNNSAGLPVFEVFADDRIVGGQYGTNDFVITNNRVGIGTSNPLAELHVTSSTSLPSAVFLGGNVGIGTTNPTTKLAVSDGTTIAQVNPSSGVGYFGTVNNYPVALSVNSSEKVRIFSGGSVSFGTTADTLFSAGNIYLNGATGNAAGPVVAFGQSDSVTGGIGHLARITGGGTSQDIFIQSQGASNSIGLNANPSGAVIYFQTQGAEKVRITAAGNVGIGTSTPATKLDIYGPVSVRGTTVLTTNFDLNAGNAADIYGNIRVLRGASLNDGMFIGYGGAGGNLRFFSNSGTTEFMTIATTGNVGIGSTSPAAKLDIVGTNTTIALSFGTTVPNNPLFINTYGSNTGIGMDQATAGLRLVGDYSGASQPLVDIGYYTGGSVSHANWVSRFKVVNSGATVFTANVYHSIGSQRLFAGSGGTHNYIYTGTTMLNFVNAADTSTLMTLLNGGSVGIGTTSPLSKLDVRGNLYVNYGVNGTGYVQTNGSDSDLQITTATNLTTLMNTGGSAGLAFGAGNSERMRITSGGNLGIGTTSGTFTLNVYNNADVWHARFGSAAGELRIGGQTSSGAVIQSFVPGSSTVRDLYIQRDGGNIGIGTTVTGYKLTVNGDLAFNGGLSTRMLVSYTNLTNGEDWANSPISIRERDQVGNTQLADKYAPNLNFHWANRASKSVWMDANGILNWGEYDASGIPAADGTFKTAILLATSNVGIGTTSPTQRLEVAGYAMAGESSYRTSIYGNASGAWIGFGDTSNTISLGRIGAYNALFNINSLNGDTSFQYNGSEKMRITTGGNVGIGTSSPTAKVDTLGVRIGRDFSLANRATVRLDANGASYPSDILFGHTAAANQDGWNGVYWSLSSRAAANSNRFYFYRGSGNPAPNNSEVVIMSFDPSLNVGIGTESPATRLDVRGVIQGQSYAVVDTSGTGQWVKLGTLTIPQNGYTAHIRAYIHAGFNALNSQDYYLDIFFKTSNASSVDANGFAGNSWYYTKGYTTSDPAPKWVGNAAGVSATAYDLYLSLPAFTNRSHYIVEIVDGVTWTNVGTLGQTNPGNGSSTVCVSSLGFTLPIGNVGIGTTALTSKLNVYDASSGSADELFLGTIGSDQLVGGRSGGSFGIATKSASNGNLILTANTGMFFRTGGSNDRMFIKNDGNVGIGTTSPDAPLMIYRASNPWLRLNGGGNFAYIRFDDGTSNGYLFKNTSSDTTNGALAGAMYTYTDSGKAFQHIHAGTPLFTILSGGNVGIGTTSPVSKLDVNGTTNFRDSISINKSVATNNWGLTIENTNTGGWGVSQYFRLYGYNSTPAASFDVLQIVASYPGYGQADFFVKSQAQSTATNVMSLLGNGNVGIGTTSPARKLDVSGSAIRSFVTAGSVEPGFIVDYPSSNGYGAFFLHVNNTRRWRIGSVGDTNVQPALNFWQEGTGSRMIINNRGNVGIGSSSPNYRLDVNGESNFNGVIRVGTVAVLNEVSNANDIYANIRVLRNRSSTNTDGMYINYDSTGTTSAHLRFYANAGNERMRIDASSGNVGIGTTSPLTLLDVRGGSITAGTAVSTSGTTILAGYYTSGTLTVLGTEYSSGGPVLGYAVSPSTSAAASFFSSTTITIPRSAYVQDGGTHRWYTGASQTVAIGSAVSTSERMRMDISGQIGIGTSTPRQILHLNGSILLDGLQNGYEQGATRAIGYGSNSGAINTDGFSGMDIQSVNAPAPNAGNYSQNLRFWTHHYGTGTGNTPRMVLQYNGNLGIGTTAPSATLTVIATNNTGSRIQLGTASNNTFMDANKVNDFMVFTAPFGASPASVSNGGAKWGIKMNGSIDTINTKAKSAAVYAVSEETNAGYNRQVGLALHTSGFDLENSEKVRITAGGNVGIGTTSPATLLHVDTAGADARIRVSAGTNTVQGGMIANTNGLVYAGSITNHGFSLRTNDTDRVRIQTDGNVGIGTTSAKNKFAVIASDTYAYYNRTEPVAVFQGLSPSTVLISADANTNGAYSELKLGNAQSTYYTYSAYIRGIQGAGIDYYRLEFGTANGSAAATRMIIATDGNVGIGTTSPGALLNIRASTPTGTGTVTTGTNILLDSNTSNYITFRNTSDNGTYAGLTFLDNNTGGYVVFRNYTAEGVTAGSDCMIYGSFQDHIFQNSASETINGKTETMRIKSSGYVGINTNNPTARLQVVQGNSGGVAAILLSSDESTIQGPSANTQIRMGGNLVLSAANISTISTNGSERVRIQSDGKVGVGTSSPNSTLTAFGDGSVNGYSGVIRVSDTAGPKWGAIGLPDTQTGTTSANNYYLIGRAGAYTDRALSLHIPNAADYGSGVQPKVGIYSTGSDLLFSAEASTGTIYAKGNVGISTTSPLARLHIVSSTAGSTVVRADGTSGTLFSVVDDLTDSLMSVNNSAGLPVFEVFADDRIVGGQYGANDFVITNNRVGIGTSNPLAELHVTGSASVPAAVFYGNVGIGTSTFSYPTSNRGLLELYGNADALLALRSAGTNFYIHKPGVDCYIVNTNSGFISIYNNGSERIRIKSDGNVGIGTSSPLAMVHVESSNSQGDNKGLIYLKSTSGTNVLKIGVDGTNNFSELRAYNPGAGDNSKLILQPYGGDVGIGVTSPTNKLEVSTGADDTVGIRVRDSVNGVRTEIRRRSIECQGGDFWINGQTSWLELRTGNTSRLYIGSNGNVGIGSTSPGALLDVNGSLKCAGKFVQNSTTQSITGTNQTLTLNVAGAAVHIVSMASGATITTISYSNRDNNPAVNTFMLVVKYAGTASITFTNVIWANGATPTLTGTNAFADVFMFTSYQGGAGTPVWIGTVVAQALVSTNL